ncbi:hypothetical protein I5F96_07285, partial [Pseudomonas aeruginosa]|nr:hypothetical protein [Pseudomonas aeruginosa]
EGLRLHRRLRGAALRGRVLELLELAGGGGARAPARRPAAPRAPFGVSMADVGGVPAAGGTLLRWNSESMANPG